MTKRLLFLPLLLSLGAASTPPKPAPNYFEGPLTVCRDKFAAAIEAKYTERAESAFQAWLACMRKQVKEI